MNIMRVLFSSFEEKNIPYLHFKSNKNLDMSFDAKGDFDVLVDKNRMSDVEKTLIECGGKRFSKPKYGVYPGVENWLFFDEEKGCIYHLHLHYQLASGKKLLKEYVIPWNTFLFDTRVKDQRFDIYISSPEAELLLLTVRTVIKSHVSDYLKSLVGLYKTYSSLQEERADLVGRVNSSIVRDHTKSLFKHTDSETVADITLKPTWTSSDFRKINKAVRTELANSRRVPPIEAGLKSSVLVLGDKYNKFLRRIVGLCRVENKVSQSGGLIIAFVGVDGSGKSTTKTNIYKFLKSQVECRQFYMGTGDGKVNLFAAVAKKLGSVYSDSSQRTSHDGQSSELLTLKNNPKKYLRKVAGALMIYSVEKSNYRKLLTMNRYRLKGGVSLLDRYPQIEIEGQNDGPKIVCYRQQLKSSMLLDLLCRKEKKLLSIVREIKPDVIFRLNISAETSMARKPEQKDISHFRKKIEQLHAITFQNAQIIDIDAEQDYEEELRCIKKEIWERL